jgi:hypothetical protein
MANELKLFNDKRLSANEPEHLVYIKQRLAEIKSDCKTPDQMAYYKQFSDFYGVDVDVVVKKEPKVEKVTETVVIQVPKKAGRPKKS